MLHECSACVDMLLESICNVLTSMTQTPWYSLATFASTKTALTMPVVRYKSKKGQRVWIRVKRWLHQEAGICRSALGENIMQHHAALWEAPAFAEYTKNNHCWALCLVGFGLMGAILVGFWSQVFSVNVRKGVGGCSWLVLTWMVVIAGWGFWVNNNAFWA